MEITFTLTKRDLIDYYKISNRNTFIAWGIIILIFAGLIVAGAVLQIKDLLAMGIFIVGFSLLFLVLNFFKILAVYKKSLETLKSDVITVELDPDYIRVKKSGKVRWENIIALIEFKNLFVLKLNKNSVFILPKREFNEQAQQLLREYFNEGIKKRKSIKKK
ncbi:MAG TPA: YcxB family protein [Clostridia bacterium]